MSIFFVKDLGRARQGRRKQMDTGRRAGNSENLGCLGACTPDNFKIQNPRNTISSVLGSDILQKSALQI